MKRIFLLSQFVGFLTLLAVEAPVTPTDAEKLGVQLRAAIFSGSVEEVRAALDHGADVNAKDSSGGSPLQSVVAGGGIDPARLRIDRSARVNVARLLLDRGADVNSKWAGSTLLQSAITTGDVDVARLLLERGAEVNAKNDYGMSPLELAVSVWRIEMVRLLLDKGADVNAKGVSGMSPLHLVSYMPGIDAKTRVDMARLLLDRGATVDLVGAHESTPLSQAVGSDAPIELVELFLQRGANINRKSEIWATPLEVAITGGHAAMAKFLLDKGASIGGADKGLVSAIMKGDLRAVKGALAPGASVSAGAPSPVFFAVLMGDPKIVAALLDKGARADSSSKKMKGFQPIHLAAFAGHVDVVKLLLDRRVPVDVSMDGESMTAFHCAATRGHAPVMRLLHARGADIRRSTKTAGQVGRSAFELALVTGSADAVAFLVDQGFDPNSPLASFNGSPPLAVAIFAPTSGAARVLLEKGAKPYEHFLAQSVSRMPELVPLLVEKGLDLSKEAGTLLYAAGQTGNVDLVNLAADNGLAMDADMAKVYAENARNNSHPEVAALILDAWGDPASSTELEAEPPEPPAPPKPPEPPPAPPTEATPLSEPPVAHADDSRWFLQVDAHYFLYNGYSVGNIDGWFQARSSALTGNAGSVQAATGMYGFDVAAWYTPHSDRDEELEFGFGLTYDIPSEHTFWGKISGDLAHLGTHAEVVLNPRLGSLYLGMQKREESSVVGVFWGFAFAFTDSSFMDFDGDRTELTQSAGFGTVLGATYTWRLTPSLGIILKGGFRYLSIKLADGSGEPVEWDGDPVEADLTGFFAGAGVTFRN